MITRRSTLKVIGLTGGLTLGAGTATARGHRDVEPTFFARLSDNPSILGHDKTNSRGKGRLDLVGGEQAPLTFELSVRSLNENASAVQIRGEGSAVGTPLVQLHGPDAIVNGDSFDGSIDGTIGDDDVALEGGVSELIWEELAEGNGIVTVQTESGEVNEIVGAVRPRPINGWIAV